MEKALNNSGPAAAKPGHRAKRAEPGRRGAKDALEWLMHTIFLLCGIVAVGFVLVISVYLIISGVPAMKEIGLTDFLLGQTWAPTASDPSYGILPFILTSIYGTAGAILIGVPIGFLTAVFLSKVAPPRVAAVIRPAVDLLAGIPSVVYGLVGMMVLLPAIRKTFDIAAGDSLLAAIIVLAVMILPSIISVSETALNAVPREYEEASLALGATELETYFRVSVPAAKSGIAAAVVLGVGRAIGEAMAILMVAGNVANQRQIPHHRHCQRDELCRRGQPPAQRPVLHWADPISVYHVHQCDPKRIPETEQGGLSYDQRHDLLGRGPELPVQGPLPPPPHL